ncbi:MAG: mechanosensitive ion channel domain-containing protein [Syntrophobacteraceae bacterium]
MKIEQNRRRSWANASRGVENLDVPPPKAVAKSAGGPTAYGQALNLESKKDVMKRHFFMPLILIAWVFAGPCPLQGKTDPQTPIPKLAQNVFGKDENAGQNREAKAAAPSFPGLPEVIPRAADLNQKASKAEEAIAVAGDTSAFGGQITDAENRANQLAKKIALMGDPAGWNIYRLLDVQRLIQGEKSKLRALLDPISAKLSNLEAIRRNWEDEHTFWQKWQESLSEAQTEIPPETFNKAVETATTVVQSAADASASVLGLQQELTKQLDEVRRFSIPVDAALKNVRNGTFRKNAPSFFSAELYEPLNTSLWTAIKDGAADAWKMEREYLPNYDYGWIIFLQVLVTLTLISLIWRRRKFPEKTRQWHFIRQHPLAFSIFAMQAAALLLYQEATPSWLLLNVALVVFSSSFLISGMLPYAGMRLAVFLLAGVLTISAFLKVISLPAPLYSLYLALICVSAIGVFFRMARLHSAEQGGRLDLFSVGLRVGSLVLFAALLLLFAGFSNLANYLVRSAIATIFSFIIAFLLLCLGNGCIEVILNQPFVTRLGFFSLFGKALESRLKNLLKAILWIGVFLTLFQLWGIYQSAGQAWGTIFGFKFSIGELTLSLGRILTAALFIYLLVSASWFIRAFLDGEVFPRREIDRGARDAIKKLIHYSLLLFGILMAISLIGLNLTSLAFLTGALGIGVGFGLQNIVNNFVSGLMLLFERPFKVGDMVVVDNETGTVRKIGLRSTVIETSDRSELIVPNSLFISGKVTNWTRSNKIARIRIPVGVAYGSDIQRALSLLKEAAEAEPRVLSDPEPNPLFLRFGDSALEFELHSWIADVRDLLSVRSAICQEIAGRFQAAGIELPFPQHDLHLRSIDEKVLGRVAGLQKKTD